MKHALPRYFFRHGLYRTFGTGVTRAAVNEEKDATRWKHREKETQK